MHQSVNNPGDPAFGHFQLLGQSLDRQVTRFLKEQQAFHLRLGQTKLMGLVEGLFLAALGNFPNQVLKFLGLVAGYLFFRSGVKIVHGVNKIKPTRGLVKKKMGFNRFF